MSRDVVVDEGKLGGEPFLKGTTSRVSDEFVKYEKLGYSVDELLSAYPELDRSDIHAALAYYYSSEVELSSIDGSAGAKPA